MVYAPSLESGVADGFYDLIDGLVGDIYKQSSMIVRLATHSGQETYQVSAHSFFYYLKRIHFFIHSFFYKWRNK